MSAAPALRDVDPLAAELADRERKPECRHPPASSLSQLACVHCGVWIQDGQCTNIDEVCRRNHPDPLERGARAWHAILERAGSNAIWLLEALRHERDADSNDAFTALLVALRVIEETAQMGPPEEVAQRNKRFCQIRGAIARTPVVGLPDTSMPGRSILIHDVGSPKAKA
jgi:hypothetical protein